MWKKFFSLARRQKYRSRTQKSEAIEYFPLVRNQLDPFVSLEREFRVEKSDTRADYVYVERISNGQTDPIRRQVGLPKFSIMERFTSLNFSTFPRFPPPFFFFFSFQTHSHSLRYRETCSPKLARFANRYSESRTCDFEHANLSTSSRINNFLRLKFF